MYSFLATGFSLNCVAIYCPYILPDRGQNLLQDICGVGSMVHTEVAVSFTDKGSSHLLCG